MTAGSKPRSTPAALRPAVARLVASLLLATGLAFTTAGVAQTVVVSAASSLTEAFEEIAVAFEAATGAWVELNFAGSSTLASQIVQGAPVDVFASADARQMDVVGAAALLAGSPVVFARNELVAVAADDGSVRELADLARAGTLVVLAGPEVPAGRYAREVLAQLDAVLGDGFAEGVLDNVVSEEPNVRQVAAKVALGEADAAIVYATDAAILPSVRTLPLPEVDVAPPEYPVAVLARTRVPELAAAFVAFLSSEEGRAILEARGFTVPPSPAEPVETAD